MTTTMPTRSQIDRAGDLDFTPRPPKSDPLTITVHAVVAGFATELCFTGSIEQLPALAARLLALGATPTSAPTPAPAAAAPAARAKAERVAPSYNADGDACCPIHKRKLSEGDYGLFCSAKAKDGQVADRKGYCGLKFED